MLAAAALHLCGATAARPPPALLSVAQLVVGAAVGSRFAGVSPASLRRVAALAALSAAAQLSMSAAAALVLRALTGGSLPLLLLSLSPGGITEMTLTALALGLDPSFVATHHTVRIVAVGAWPRAGSVCAVRADNAPQ
jgi:membrane AbrB-like protein